jgi:hypothetical protein
MIFFFVLMKIYFFFIKALFFLIKFFNKENLLWSQNQVSIKKNYVSIFCMQLKKKIINLEKLCKKIKNIFSLLLMLDSYI